MRAEAASLRRSALRQGLGPQTRRRGNGSDRSSLVRHVTGQEPVRGANGYVGGFTPHIATTVVAATGDLYSGLYFPIGVAAITLVVGSLFKESFRTRIWGEVKG